jgi:hypothetical protein
MDKAGAHAANFSTHDGCADTDNDLADSGDRHPVFVDLCLPWPTVWVLPQSDAND